MVAPITRARATDRSPSGGTGGERSSAPPQRPDGRRTVRLGPGRPPSPGFSLTTAPQCVSMTGCSVHTRDTLFHQLEPFAASRAHAIVKGCIQVWSRTWLVAIVPGPAKVKRSLMCTLRGGIADPVEPVLSLYSSRLSSVFCTAARESPIHVVFSAICDDHRE